MADHPHTIDRWDDATGENLIEQIAAVGDYLRRAGDLSCGGEALAKGQDHAAQPGAGDRAELAGLAGRAVSTALAAPLKAGGIIRSARCGMIWETRSAMAAARTTANANATTSTP